MDQPEEFLRYKGGWSDLTPDIQAKLKEIFKREDKSQIISFLCSLSSTEKTLACYSWVECKVNTITPSLLEILIDIES